MIFLYGSLWLYFLIKREKQKQNKKERDKPDNIMGAFPDLAKRKQTKKERDFNKAKPREILSHDSKWFF